MTNRQKRSLSLLLPVWCLLTAFLLLAFGSKNSFLYPMNDWVDVNCFFTVGRGILDGKMPYLDLFEQKGPLLYLWYALGALVSRHSFLGVYLLESLLVGGFLLTAAVTVRTLSGAEWAAWLSAPVICGGMLLSPAFCHGGSAEELTLVFLALPLFLCLRAARENRALHAGESITFGLCAGVCLWVKYTFLGLSIGLGVWLLGFAVRTKNRKAFGRFLLLALCGLLTVTAPILLWFLARGALNALIDVYFIQNIFTYASSASARHAGPLESLLLNGWWTVFLPLGPVFFLIRKEYRPLPALLLGLGGLFLTTFIGGKTYPYYTLILISLTGPGLALFGLIPLRRVPFRPLAALVCAGGLAFFGVKVWRDSPNAYLRGPDRNTMPPYRFAEIIRQTEGASLLNLGFLDGGFYFASGTEPVNRFFCTLNMDLAEMSGEQQSLIRSGALTYIVTRGSRSDPAGYTCIDTASFPFEGREWSYQLWQYTGETNNSNRRQRRQQ